jgi:hypothetical protein
MKFTLILSWMCLKITRSTISVFWWAISERCKSCLKFWGIQTDCRRLWWHYWHDGSLQAILMSHLVRFIVWQVCWWGFPLRGGFEGRRVREVCDWNQVRAAGLIQAQVMSLCCCGPWPLIRAQGVPLMLLQAISPLFTAQLKLYVMLYLSS